MHSFCFVHAADLHLDTPFQGIRAEAPEVAAVLRDASLDAFDALVELCLQRRAAFLLLAGDLYDGAERGIHAQLRFHKGLARLAEAGVRVLAVHGNHDPLDEGWSAIQTWPEGVTFFESGEVQSVGIERGGARIATVHGVSYATRETHENLATRFRRGDDPGLQVGLLHCKVGGAPDHASYSPCSLSDLRAAGMDYWALGHIHQQSVLSEEPWVVYAGNLQGRSPKPSERGEKGAVVVHVEAGAVREVEPVALDRVRFVELEVDVSDCEDFGDLEAALLGACRSARDDNAGRALVLRGRLVGRSSQWVALGRKGALEELLGVLRDASAGFTPFAWWESLRSAVQRPVDRERLRSRDDFASELCAQSDALAASPEALAAFFEAHGEVERRPGIDLSPLSDAERSALLAEGEALALDLLAAGDLE